MGPDRAMLLSGAIQGHMTPPVLGGVALVLPLMRPFGRLRGLEKWLTTAE